MDPEDPSGAAKRIFEARDRMAPRFPDVDPGDLLPIVESILRPGTEMNGKKLQALSQHLDGMPPAPISEPSNPLRAERPIDRIAPRNPGARAGGPDCAAATPSPPLRRLVFKETSMKAIVFHGV